MEALSELVNGSRKLERRAELARSCGRHPNKWASWFRHSRTHHRIRGFRYGPGCNHQKMPPPKDTVSIRTHVVLRQNYILFSHGTIPRTMRPVQLTGTAIC